MTMLEDVIAKLTAMPEGERAAVTERALAAIKSQRWLPNPGPQTDAYFSQADVLLYGGEGGGGKSGLLIGLALAEHERSLIMRRRYTDLSSLTEDAVRLNGTRLGFNASSPPKLRTQDGRLIEFGAVAKLGDEQNWMGRPHDFLGLDEGCQFLEIQVRTLLGWIRTTKENQRCRCVIATNPPTTQEGLYLVKMFRPWLDPYHHRPAAPGELRWYVVKIDNGKHVDIELDGPDQIVVDDDGKRLEPHSRTFIRASVKDNPFLGADYQKQLDSLPEPYRSAVRDGNFMSARTDDAWQVIPSEWVRLAQARWTPQPPKGFPMTAMGVDVAQGGVDDTVLAPRHGPWFAPLIRRPGSKTPYGKDVAGLIITERRDDAVVVIDLGGGYGGAAFEHLKNNDANFPIIGYKGAVASRQRTADRKLIFANLRSQAIWRFREALDPSQRGGSQIMLPDDPDLTADLTAPTYRTDKRGNDLCIIVESKEDVCDRLNRSTDGGDAVIMSWHAESKEVRDTVANAEVSEQGGRGNRGARPQVHLGHDAARRSQRR